MISMMTSTWTKRDKLTDNLELGVEMDQMQHLWGDTIFLHSRKIREIGPQMLIIDSHVSQEVLPQQRGITSQPSKTPIQPPRPNF